MGSVFNPKDASEGKEAGTLPSLDLKTYSIVSRYSHQTSDLSLFGNESILGRGIAISDSKSHEKIACCAITLTGTLGSLLQDD